jgi:hypothetical protein
MYEDRAFGHRCPYRSVLTTDGGYGDSNAILISHADGRSFTDAKPNSRWFLCGGGQQLPD